MNRSGSLVNHTHTPERSTAAPEQGQTQHTAPAHLCPLGAPHQQPDSELFHLGLLTPNRTFPTMEKPPWGSYGQARTPRPAPPGPLAPHPQSPAPRAPGRALRGEGAPPPPASPAGTCGHGPSHIPAGSGEPRGDGGTGGRSGRREGPEPVRSSAMRGGEGRGRGGTGGTGGGSARRGDVPGPSAPSAPRFRQRPPEGARPGPEPRPPRVTFPFPQRRPPPGWRSSPHRGWIPA